MYPNIGAGQTNVCSTQTGGGATADKLGNHKFFRFTTSTPVAVTISATGAVAPSGASVAATDPDIYVFKRGSLEALGDSSGPSEMISQHALAAGTYIIDVFDFDVQSANTNVRRCMNVSLQILP